VLADKATMPGHRGDVEAMEPKPYPPERNRKVNASTTRSLNKTQSHRRCFSNQIVFADSHPLREIEKLLPGSSSRIRLLHLRLYPILLVTLLA